MILLDLIFPKKEEENIDMDGPAEWTGKTCERKVVRKKTYWNEEGPCGGMIMKNAKGQKFCVACRKPYVE